MYAELNVALAAGVEPNTVRDALKRHFGSSTVEPNDALQGTPIAGYVAQAVGAAEFPNGIVVIYLCIARDEILVYVYGRTISKIKAHCAKAVKLIKKINGVKISTASASILIPVNGTDVDLLTGAEGSWFGAFWGALVDKIFSKFAAAAVNAGLAYIVFPSSSNPLLSALVGVGATAVGVVVEASYAAWLSESWSWKESQ